MNYNIGEISKIVDIPTSTLRFYEKEGLLPHVKRDKNGIRIYDKDDLFWIDIVKCLRETGMKISDIKHIVELSALGEATEFERKRILLNHKKKVLDEVALLEKYLKKIDQKIKWYEDKENTCCREK